MAPRVPLPNSGRLLGLILSALRLRQAVEEVVPKRTLVRVLKGGPGVKPDTRLEVVQATVRALLDDGLLEWWGLPAEGAEATRDAAVAALDAALVRWDQAVGTLRSRGPKVPSVAFAALPWVRLFAIEGALRYAAYAVTRGEPPMSVEAARALMAGRFFDYLLGTYRERAGGLIREDIAAGANVAESTVDEWLAGKSLPQSESILDLAAVLTDRVPDLDEAEANFHLRVAVAVSELVRWIWAVCPQPREGGEFGPPRAAQFVIEFTTAQAIVRFLIDGMMEQHGERLAPDLWALALDGSVTPHGKVVLAAVLDSARDSYLRADIEGVVYERWTERVLLLYRQIPKPENRQREAALMKKVGLPDMPPEFFSFAEEMMSWGAVSPNPGGWHVPAFPPEEEPPAGEDDFVAVMSNESFPNRPDIVAKHAMEAQHIHDDPFEALGHHQRLVHQDPESEMYRFWLGCSLAAVGRPDEGIIECRIACSLKPDWSLPATEVAIILGNAGRYEDALESIKLTAEQYEVDGHMAYAYGYILLRLDRLSEAAQWFRRVLDENDAHPEALANLAHCLLLTGERREGRKFAKLAFHAGERQVLEALNAGHYDA